MKAQRLNDIMRDYLEAKAYAIQEFLEYVQDTRNPITDRLEMWEAHAHILIISDFCVGSTTLRDAFDPYKCASRGDLVLFEDVAEMLAQKPVYAGSEYEDLDNKAFLHKVLVVDEDVEAIAVVEEMFACGFYGYRNDW